ncbi:MAG: hypothetical protein ACK5PB_17970 [Pirellula sp.]
MMTPYTPAAHDDFDDVVKSLGKKVPPPMTKVVIAQAKRYQAFRQLLFEPESLDQRCVADFFYQLVLLQISWYVPVARVRLKDPWCSLQPSS